MAGKVENPAEAFACPRCGQQVVAARMPMSETRWFDVENVKSYRITLNDTLDCLLATPTYGHDFHVHQPDDQPLTD